MTLPTRQNLRGHKGTGWSSGVNAEEREALQRAFDGPHGPCPFEHVAAAKFRVYDGHYVVCRVEPPGQQPFYADLARGRQGQDYEFQNDSLEMTDWQWKHVSIPEECDSFTCPADGDIEGYE
jgi:hypothetical protein